MKSKALYKRLSKLIGKDFKYLSNSWRLIDILSDSDQIVLQKISTDQKELQFNQYGQVNRRSSETITLPISNIKDENIFSEELILLMEGRIIKSIDNF
mgnify:CR=1 FL=1|tara:strand:- start:5127 stop:5420 length:294 start_codon:yes stop_codon:yes gene_type:complete